MTEPLAFTPATIMSPSGLPIGAVVDDSVAEPSKLWKSMQQDRDLVRAIYAGTRNMQARKDLLLKEPGESDKAYEIRRKRTFLFNGVKRAVNVIGGKPFLTPVVPLGASTQIEEWSRNIDMTGRSLHVFARDIFGDALLDGMAMFIVDTQAQQRDEDGIAKQQSLEDVDRSGKRPYWIGYSLDEVIGWITSIVDGMPFVEQLRIVEMATTREKGPKGLWHERPVKKIRVWHAPNPFLPFPIQFAAWEVYRELDDDDPRKTPEGQYILEDFDFTTLDFIPLVPVYTGHTGHLQAFPPLDDMAWMNLKHWQGSSDQAHALHIARIPWYFGSGFKLPPGQKFVIGPNVLQIRQEKDAKITPVEHGGKAIEAGAKDQETTKAEMASLWSEILAPPSHAMTATESLQRSTESESPAQAMARDLEKSLELGIKITELLAGITPSKATVPVYKEFRLSGLDEAEDKVLLEMRKTGDLSLESLHEELIRRGRFGESFTHEREKERLEKEAEDEMKGARDENVIPELARLRGDESVEVDDGEVEIEN